jgi:uncharacterized protein (DUF58 family)
MSRNPTAPERVLHRLDWTVVRRLDGLVHGDYRTRLYGAGLEFADLREYTPGDDVRRIDWNVTARTTVPFVRQFVAERDLTAWLLLDRSPSMAFGDELRTKDVVALEFVTAIARLLTRNGNRVGAILYDNTVEAVLEPRSGRNQVLRIARALMRPARDPVAATELGGLLRIALETVRRRSLVFVVSDFISEPGWERELTLLARRHEVVAVRLIDPRELELPDAGLLVMQDSETGEQLFVDTSDPHFRRRFKEAAAAREEHIDAAARRAGVDLHPLRTDDDLVRSLVRMVEVHRRRARR